ncbi:MAG: methyltransferase, TIGR04325 family [Candidatus Berkiellales bacterium]
MLKNIYLEIIPPFFQKKIKNLLFKKRGYFSGPYPHWQAARDQAKGYDAPEVLETVKGSYLQAKKNPNLFIRDGMIFTQPQYAYPVLAMLLKVALENHHQLSVLDFGGGLGSSYYAFKHFCASINPLLWHVVEQPHFVDCGKKFFTSSELHFYQNINDITDKPQVILLSAVLQYIENPYELLQQLLQLNVPYLILDRIWFTANKPQDLLLVEHVDKNIYNSSYPCWLFNQTNIIQALSTKYNIIDEYPALEGTFTVNQFKIASKGLLLKRKST